MAKAATAENLRLPEEQHDILARLGRENASGESGRHVDPPELERLKKHKWLRAAIAAIPKPANYVALFVEHTGLEWMRHADLFCHNRIEMADLDKIEIFMRRLKAGVFAPPDPTERETAVEEPESPRRQWVEAIRAEKAPTDLNLARPIIETNDRLPSPTAIRRAVSINTTPKPEPMKPEDQARHASLCKRYQAIEKPNGWVARFEIDARCDHNTTTKLKSGKHFNNFQSQTGYLFDRIERTIEKAESGKLMAAPGPAERHKIEASRERKAKPRKAPNPPTRRRKQVAKAPETIEVLGVSDALAALERDRDLCAKKIERLDKAIKALRELA